MPSIQGADDFNHAINAGYYTDGFFGTPVAVSSPVYQSDPKSLSITADGGNVGVRHNIDGTPTIAWAGFPFRTETMPGVGVTSSICSFGTASGIAPTVYLGSTGIFVSIVGVDSSVIAINADEWYWIECILDVTSSTRRIHFRVNGVSGVAEHSDSATTVSWHQLISFAGDTSAIQRYFGRWQWGTAASAEDWQGSSNSLVFSHDFEDNSLATYDSTLGTPAIQTSIAYQGARALRCNPSASQHRLNKITTSTFSKAAVQFRARREHSGAESPFMFILMNASGGRGFYISHHTTEGIRLVAFDWDGGPGETILDTYGQWAMNAWTKFDVRIDASAATWQLEWMVDDVIQGAPSVAHQVTPFSQISFGVWNYDMTWDAYYDAVKVSEQNAFISIGKQAFYFARRRATR